LCKKEATRSWGTAAWSLPAGGGRGIQAGSRMFNAFLATKFRPAILDARRGYRPEILIKEKGLEVFHGLRKIVQLVTPVTVRQPSLP
jgi:hypothetical protein